MTKPTQRHDFPSRVVWTGNRGTGTSAYRAYDRTWMIEVEGRAPIHCSNDPMLGGNPDLPNPEDLMISALSACHMLWYLHLASVAGITVLSYEDAPVGTGETAPDGAGRFVEAVLRPRIEVKRGADLSRAAAIHGEIHRYCFIARSVNFPVRVEPMFHEAASDHSP
ncbi:OsmC family protein [Amaricoccus macauensis]|uniref:OsmC family protein n=1 Tax=Amaricoccus macauensis TaxID=57001 RepID=UPI003C7D2586